MPDKTSTNSALISPVVWLSRVARDEAVRVVSERFTASLPIPVISEDAYI